MKRYFTLFCLLLVTAASLSCQSTRGKTSLMDLTVEFPVTAFRMSAGEEIPTESLGSKFEHLNRSIRKQHPRITQGPFFVSPRAARVQVEGWTKQFSTCVPLVDCTLRDFMPVYERILGIVATDTNEGILIDLKGPNKTLDATSQ